MKKSLLKVSTILFGLAVLTITGCQKESTTSQQEPWDQNSTEASSLIALNTFDALSALTDKTFSTDNPNLLPLVLVQPLRYKLLFLLP